MLERYGHKLVLAGLLLAAAGLAACLLWLPGLSLGPAQREWQRPGPKIARQTAAAQSFFSPRPGLSRLDLLLAIYGRPRFKPLTCQLFRLGPEPPAPEGPPDLSRARLILEKTLSRTSGRGLVSLSFPAQSDSAGAYYLIRLTRSDPNPAGGVSAWLSPGSLEDGRLWIGGRPRPGAMAFQTYYRSRESNLARLLARFTRERPLWLTPRAAAAATALVWLLVLFLITPRGRAARLAWLAPPLLGLAAWLMLGLAGPDQGLWAVYRSGPDPDRPAIGTAVRYFAWGQPGQRRELDPHFDLNDLRYLGLDPRVFGVTWSGRLKAPAAGDYDFEVETGGRADLWLAGRRIAAQPGPGEVVRVRGRASLAAGLNDFRLFYGQGSGPARLALRWGPAGGRLRLLDAVDLRPPGQADQRGWLITLAAILLWLGCLPGLVLLGRGLVRGAAAGLKRPEGQLLALILLAALAVRLIYLFQIEAAFEPAGRDFYTLPDGTDQGAYLFLSRGLLKGFWPLLRREPFDYGPAQPFLLAGLQALLGRDLFLIRLALHGLGLVSVGLVWLLARRLFGLWPGLLAAGLLAWSGLSLVYESSLLIAGPLGLALIAAACFLDRAVFGEGGWPDWLRAGLALGLAALLRGNAVLILPWLVPGLWAAGRLDRPRLKGLGLLVAAAAVLLALPTAWNLGLFGNRLLYRVAAPASIGPSVLWMGNNPAASGLADSDPALVREVQARVNQGRTTWLREVIDFVVHRPGDWLALTLSKTWRFFNGWEPPHNVDYYGRRSQAAALRWGMLNFALLGPLGLAGLGLAWPRRRRVAPLAAMILGYAGAVILFYVMARFRAPLLPLLAVFGGFALSRLGAGLRPALACLGLAALFYVLVNWDQLWLSGQPSQFWRYWDLTYSHFGFG